MTNEQIKQTIKWIVYSLLLINFGFYFVEDAVRASHTLTADSTLLDWTNEFANTIDESAWFMLLFTFELETYVLPDSAWTSWVGRLVRGVRIVGFVMIAHTVYAYLVSVSDLKPTVPVENVSSLCELADQDLSYVFNLRYSEITPENCESLSPASQFYRVAEDPIVSDAAGLALERDLALADLAEVLIWLLIILTIELVVRFQERGITEGRLLIGTKLAKVALYLSLFGLGVYWATLSHWLYFWDELVWICGFAAIEANVSQWRDEIESGQVDASPAR